MISAKTICIELFGVNKRIIDIKNISRIVDKQLDYEKIGCTQSANCYMCIYNFGYIVYYTWPEKKMLNIDILSCLSESQNSAIKKTFLEVFKPSQYLYSDLMRITGFD
jgi:S-adenosylmethionine/arginine decarboxylase-like enzyme